MPSNPLGNSSSLNLEADWSFVFSSFLGGALDSIGIITTPGKVGQLSLPGL